MQVIFYKISQSLLKRGTIIVRIIEQIEPIQCYMEVRGYVSANIFRPIYNAIFDSHLNYGTFVWGQNANAIKRNIFSKKRH